MNSNNDHISSEPIRVTEHYWIRQEIGILGKQWSVYRCGDSFVADHFNFVSAPEEKQDAIKICKMLEPKRKEEKPNDKDMILLIACAAALIAMMILPVIILV